VVVCEGVCVCVCVHGTRGCPRKNKNQLHPKRRYVFIILHGVAPGNTVTLNLIIY